MNIYQWKTQIKEFNARFKQNTETHIQWNENTKENLTRFKKSQSIWNFEWKYYKEDEKAIVLVGASPRLSEDVDKLKELNDNFRIICANSSLKFLLRHGIKPDYCICVDSDHVDIPQHLDIDRDDITLLASTVVWGKVLDNWKGPIYYLPYYSIDNELKTKVRKILGKAVPGGGNSITEALYIASIIFGSKTIIFVGNEYCFDTVKDYYADKETSKQEKMLVRYPIVDVKGKERWTQPAHYVYAIWTEKMCADLSPPGYFIDTSFGVLGKDDSAIHVMELSEAIKKVNKAFIDAKRLNETKSERGRLKILRELVPKNEPSSVYRYNMQEHRERILQLARS